MPAGCPITNPLGLSKTCLFPAHYAHFSPPIRSLIPITVFIFTHAKALFTTWRLFTNFIEHPPSPTFASRQHFTLWDYCWIMQGYKLARNVILFILSLFFFKIQRFQEQLGLSVNDFSLSGNICRTRKIFSFSVGRFSEITALYRKSAEVNLGKYRPTRRQAQHGCIKSRTRRTDRFVCVWLCLWGPINLALWGLS